MPPSPLPRSPEPEPTRAPSLFAASIDEPRPRSGISIWLSAAAALVFGIVLGFASGYRAARVVPAPAAGFESPTPTSGGGQTFSESSVSDPVKLNPEPVVPAPDTSAGSPDRVQAGPRRRPERAAEPAPQPQPTKAPARGGQPADDLAVVGRVPPRTQAVAADPSARPSPTVTGPGSLQVVSRPAGAQVVLDGRAIGKTPMTIPEVSVGKHSIRLELPGFQRWETTEDVKAGSATRVAASLEQ